MLKGEMKNLVRSSVENTFNDLLYCEADALVNVRRMNVETAKATVSVGVKNTT